MRVHLLLPGRDFDPAAADPPGAQDVVADLGLDVVLDTVAGGEEAVAASARVALLHGLTDPADVLYRQGVLQDCRRAPEAVRRLRDVAQAALAARRGVFRSVFADRPAFVLGSCLQVLGAYVDHLRDLRGAVESCADSFSSEGLARFCADVLDDLAEEHLQEASTQLSALADRGELLVSARLGHGGGGEDHAVRVPHESGRGPWRHAVVSPPRATFTIADRDEAGAEALALLRDRGLAQVTEAVVAATDHLTAFFTQLDVELGFAQGCTRLAAALEATGASTCWPQPAPVEHEGIDARALRDPVLLLRARERVVANDLHADDAALVLVTGANRGGKSSFLRALVLARLLLGAGMPVAAQSFTAGLLRGVWTHYVHEQDATMTRGTFDEELARMSALADALVPGALLVSNESFSSTNEREGSQVAVGVVRGLLDAGVRVHAVTHLHEASVALEDADLPSAVFLRAERGPGGERTFRVVPGRAERTSYAQDLADRILGGSREDAGEQHDRPRTATEERA